MERSENSWLYSTVFIGAVAVVTVGLASLAWITADRTWGLAGAVLGVYLLHLMSLRFIVVGQADNRASLDAQWKLLQLLVDPNAIETGEGVPYAAAGRAAQKKAQPAGGSRQAMPGGNGDGPEAGGLEAGHRIPTPRHFALGTVALIRDLLTPAQVAHILIEQRQQPDERFAAIAVDLGLLTEEQREELLLAQQEGLFTDEEMREARQRLSEFRKATARALATRE
ncbi:MAG: hypothetical protein OEM96_07560 [Gemmatimonadota bacterium]|nr:hypothetical protein [Gemmatimonadota bacterium]